MTTNFNSIQTLKSREICDKFSKSVSYKTLVGGTTTGTGIKQTQKMLLGSANKPLSAVGTLTSLLHNSAKVVEKLLHRHSEPKAKNPKNNIKDWILRFANAPLRMTIPALAFLLSLNLSTAFAGSCKCDLDGNTLTISTCPNGLLSESSCNGQKTANNVIIGTGVISIGDYAFNRNSSLTSITIPDSVKSIEKAAFRYASSLTSITIPDSVTSIGDQAFQNASSLESITIPDSVTSIGGSAFQNASSLKSITIPEGVTSIGNYAFDGAKSLTSITIPDSVTSIGRAAFNNASSLTSITIPDSVTSIGKYAFYGASSLANIICKGDEASCAATADALRAKGYKGKISYPTDQTSCEGSDISLYVWDGRKCRRRNENQCNATGKYYYNGETCLYRPRDRQIVCVNPNYKANDGYCDRLRYTPAEAAKVLTDDNTNSVTITFKK